MMVKLSLHSKLMKNARCQVRQSFPKSADAYKDQAALSDAKMKRIHGSVGDLRRKHAKLLE